MQKYIVTAFIPDSEEEKEEYLSWSLVNIQRDEKNKIFKRDRQKFTLNFYKENEKMMIKFFEKFFILNDCCAEVYLEPVNTGTKQIFLYNERKKFWNYMKKLSFEQLFLREKIMINNKKDFDFFIKLGYRSDEKQCVKIIFENLDIKSESTGEYSYILFVDESSELKTVFEI
ncbi:hypothetical protein [Pseudoleptotrichia goodfellowii]|uniref:Uncharacterized protein n=1 Tax=Pseudoleptotrichia goodfellowii F0264 TaxID=596323 RepID=D0GKR8_9FUSO|nr:hypothetical protein [Pseudoleptotrichia goodfellowii]EEY35306.1 hypothetical protein HMPREF0554_2187 [Pseudoleptotrichia goodfellowii F0264]